MEHARHARDPRTSTVRVVVAPATSYEVALLFPALIGLLLAILLL